MMNYTFKIKSSICAALGVLLLCGATVNANYEQVGDNSVAVKGTTTCGHAEEVFGVDVWAPEKSLNDLRKEKDREKYTDILIFREQLISGKNGEYEFLFDLGENAENGFYKAVINCACGAELSEDVFYCNPEDNKKALEELSQKNNAEEVFEFCNGVDSNGEKNIYKLGFIYDFEMDIYSAEILLNFVKSHNFSTDDKAGSISAYKKAVVLSAIRNGKVENMFDYADVLGIRTSRIAEFITNGAVTEKIKRNTTSRVAKSEVKSFEDYENLFYESFVLSAVLNTNGYSDIGDIVEEFANEIGVSKRPSDKSLISVMNCRFDSYKELCEALLSSGGSNGSGNGPSSGGGGGSSSGGGGKKETIEKNTYSEEYITTEENIKISSVIFDDIDSVPWAVDAIVELAEQGIINGREKWKFYPEDNILREEVTKLISEAFLSGESVLESSGFSDVRIGEWYEKYINLAYKCGVITGTGEGKFGTGTPITREDMAVVAYRTAIYKGLISEDAEESGYKFSDDDMISDYAKKAVYVLENKKVINGIGNGLFAPKAVLTRAQAAKIIYELYTVNK
jgi:hypothetical protein